jgi:predicted 2-oxoglutarate/Fe(II)-dependent dioxygenase YbiX
MRQIAGAAELRQLHELAASGDPHESRKRNEEVDLATAEGQAAAQLVRDAGQRALPLELSQAISNLQPTLGDSVDFNRLTASYHNLVRMWAQP